MHLVDYLISLVFALIMFGIGASLKLADFKYVFYRPKALLLGLFLQMLFVPFITMLVLASVNLSPYFKAGLFILALVPGGTTSNFISYLLKTDVPLSISLTSLNSLLILITIPVFATYGLDFYLDGDLTIKLNAFKTVQQVFTIVIVPVVLGVLFNQFFYKLSEKMQQPLKYFNIGLLTMVFAIKIFAKESDGGSGINLADVFKLLPITLFVHFASMLGAYIISKWALKREKQAITIAIEVGLQNTTLALFITSTIIAVNEITKPILVYAVFSFFTTFAFGYLLKRKWKF